MKLPAMRSAASALLLLLAASAQARYHGREIGALSQLHHGVRGTVFAVDARTLYIHDFHYDGVGPAAFFYVGTSKTPNAAGATRLRDERGGTGPLRRYRGEGVTISLPDGVTLRDVKWFSVWCDEYSVNFGDVSIPRDLEYPKPAKVGALRGVHGVSSDPVVVVDAQTLLVPNFSYDGEAPDAKFWVGRGETPSPQGIRIPDENGKEAPLRKYDKKTIVLTLPGELTVFDIGHFAVWCEAFTVNFGHVVLPRSALANVPPSLKMLGVSPQSRNSALAAQTRAPAAPRVRQKIAKLDATTYRPALALAAGPRAAPDHRPATHEHLHRRAYTQTFPQEQLVQVQPSQELKYNYQDQQSDREQQHQNQEDFYQQYQEQQKQNQYKKQEDLYKHQQEQTDNQQHSQDLYRLDQEQQNQNQYKDQRDSNRHQQDQTDKQQHSQDLYRLQQEQQDQNRYKSQEELYRQYQEEKEKQNQENQKLYHLQRQQDQQNNPNFRRQQVYQNQHLQRPQEHYQSQHQYQEPAQQQSIQYQNEDRRQQQSPSQRYQGYDDERAQYQRQLYERQLYEQQRLAYERELLSQRRQEEEPFRYRLLPYSYQSKLNCEVLHDELAFEVRWAVAGDSIVLQLVAKLEDGEYMSFGISGDPAHSQMVGGDVAVAWVDKDTLKGYAVDYYLDAKSQCAGVRGSCPDERLGEKTNSVRLLNAALVNGYSIVTYQRALRAADELDRPVLTNQSQPVIWALGPLNSRNEVSYHHHFTKGDKFIEFGRPPVWNCPMPENEDEHRPEPQQQEVQQHRPVQESTAVIKPNPVPTPKPVAKVEPWEIPAIQCYEPPDGVFYAQMGPTGGKQGYSAITGHVGWGISWYINGLLIPEINVVRGRKYTFVVEGGYDPAVPARYHPFYITNDPVGGYYHKNDQEKKGVEIYAGVRRSRYGELIPTGVGRLCNWTPDNNGPEADEYPSFGAYQRSLTLVCEEGNPGVVTWVPDKNTPDTVYYQCFTHRHLGWKINVHDECDESEAEESRVEERVVAPDDLHGEESIQVRSRLPPDQNFLDRRQKIEKVIDAKPTYDDFSRSKGDGGRQGEALPREEFELPVSKVQIKEVIRAVENIESEMRDEMRRNQTRTPTQYRVHENVDESFLPERPVREGDEYVVGRTPETFFLPPNQQPLTLQSVMRPNQMNKQGGQRPPFRRPLPPEIKLRRPPQGYPKGNNYPLPMPGSHNPSGMHKKVPPKHRGPMNQGRPMPPGVPPMKAMPPLPHGKPSFIHNHKKHGPNVPEGPVQSIVIGKPSVGGVSYPQNYKMQNPQTLNLGQPDIIMNQVVRSQITLPGAGDSLPQHTVPQNFGNKPGQIILGKPMDNPLPLDQQMTHTKHHGILTPPKPASDSHSQTIHSKLENDREQAQNEVKSSDFMGESIENSTFVPAVNTGFKPDSIVIESGFKPIIREPLMAAEDRITDDGDSNANRREDTDVEEDYEEAPQYINHAYPSDKITETFEPMFIPSPEDHLLATEDRTKEIFPSNHAKEDRPHPVYVKTENELNALFGKKNLEKEVPSDMVMESNKVSPQYLPPDPKLPKETSQKLSSSSQTFTTYDGKTVSAATLTSIPDGKPNIMKNLFSSKLPANSELLLKTPQFGPFKGEIPPIVGAQISTDTVKELSPPISDMRTTRLKLVNSFHKEDESEKDDLKPEESGKDEVKRLAKEDELDEEMEEDEYEDDGEEEPGVRSKRESKTAQFEKGEVEEQIPPQGSSSVDSQMDFEWPRATAASCRLSLHWTIYPVLLILKSFF